MRLWWLATLDGPAGRALADFETWRDDTRILMNVKILARVFEGYLRKKYGQPVAIRVETYEDGGLRICLEEEGDTQRLRPCAGGGRGTPTAEVPLEGGTKEQFGTSMLLFAIPAGRGYRTGRSRCGTLQTGAR